MVQDSDHSIIDIDPEIKVEEKTKNGTKKRLQLNPAKAVIGGIAQSKSAVIGVFLRVQMWSKAASLRVRNPSSGYFSVAIGQDKDKSHN